MGQLTNVYGLPEAIVRAITNDPYNSGDCDISTTRLIDTPRVVALKKRHAEEIVEDVTERVWSLLGQAVHTILERASPPGVISEKRYFADVLGWKVSGAVDLINGDTLQDYKVTACYSYMYGSRIADYTAQANTNRFLAYENGARGITKLENVLILRDWQSSKVGTAKYPAVQIVTVPLELWPIEKAKAYVYERVMLHQHASTLSDDELPECTDEERWWNPGGFRTKPGYRRCEKYCAASQFCSQANAKAKVA